MSQSITLNQPYQILISHTQKSRFHSNSQPVVDYPKHSFHTHDFMQSRQGNHTPHMTRSLSQTRAAMLCVFLFSRRQSRSSVPRSIQGQFTALSSHNDCTALLPTAVSSADAYLCPRSHRHTDFTVFVDVTARSETLSRW